LADPAAPLVSAATGAPGATGAIGATGGDYGLAGAAAQMALALILILGVILLAYYLLKKFGPKLGIGMPGRSDKLVFLGHLPLGPKKNVVMVRFLNRILLLGVTEHSINYLTETKTDDPDFASDFKAVLDKTAGNDPSS